MRQEAFEDGGIAMGSSSLGKMRRCGGGLTFPSQKVAEIAARSRQGLMLFFPPLCFSSRLSPLACEGYATFLDPCLHASVERSKLQEPLFGFDRNFVTFCRYFCVVLAQTSESALVTNIILLPVVFLLRKEFACP